MTLDDRARQAAESFRRAADELGRTTPDRWSFEQHRRYLRRRERGQRNAAIAVAIVIVALFGAAARMVMSEPGPQILGPMPTPVGTNTANGRIVFNENLMRGDMDFVTSYTVNTDGSDRVRLGPEGTTVCGGNNASWSLDGIGVVCQAYREDLTVGTATVNADGSNYRLVTNEQVPRSFACVAWSPDAQRLFCPFTSDGVYTIGRDGGDPVRLTSMFAGTGPNGYVDDGSHAYFTVVDPTDRRRLYALKTDGSGDPVALSPPSVSVHDNSYFDGVSADSSPDGSRVVFAADVSQTSKALYIATTDGSDLREIEAPGIAPTSAQWSPNGNWIALSALPADAATYEVYLIHPSGTGLTQITSPTDACSSYAPIWSPDGTALLLETQCMDGATITSTSLQIANLDGSDLSKVVDLHGLTSYAWGRLGD